MSGDLDGYILRQATAGHLDERWVYWQISQKQNSHERIPGTDSFLRPAPFPPVLAALTDEKGVYRY
jgi:hypothetical protein